MTEVSPGVGPCRAGSVTAVRAAVVVPVKAFHDAKRRLASVLSPGERERLARRMATGVVAAAGDLPVTVVCDDPAVRDWASSVGAVALWTPPPRRRGGGRVVGAADERAERALVAHADLPRPATSDRWWAAGVVVVPDRYTDGTNVISVPATSGFRWLWPASFRRHRTEATWLGLPVEVIADPELSWDGRPPTPQPGGIDLLADVG